MRDSVRLCFFQRPNSMSFQISHDDESHHQFACSLPSTSFSTLYLEVKSYKTLESALPYRDQRIRDSPGCDPTQHMIHFTSFILA